MEARDEVLGEVVREFSVQLKKALESTELAEEEKMALSDRYLQSFSENIKFAVTKTFGQAVAAETAASAGGLPAAGTEVTPDDIEKMQTSLDLTASRRARYPEKCAKLLDRTLSTNYKILKNLQVDVPPFNLPQPPATEADDAEHAEHLKTTVNLVQDCKVKFDENLEKAGRLIDAFNVLENNVQKQENQLN